MPDDTPTTPAAEKKPFLGLSMTQLVGGSAAAATAAVLGARLGTTGTIIGAALVSVVSAVASAFYQASIKHTREVVARTAELLPGTGTWRSATHGSVPEVAEQAVSDGMADATPSPWQRIRWKSVGIAAGIFFAVTALVITGFELITGRSVDGGAGTTVSQVAHGGRHSTPTPSPTPEPSSKPTTHSSSGSSSPRASVTPTSGASGTATPSSSPSITPSASSSPTTSTQGPTSSSPSASPAG